MLFIEFRFFIFFLLVLGVHWALRTNRSRKLWLLICSHFFYACFFVGDPLEFLGHVRAGEWGKLPTGWWFPLVLMGSTCMDYAVGLGIGNAQTELKRRGWLLASLGVNLGVLCFFKYYNFFIVSASGFLHWVGLPAGDWTLRIFLPYGISFYTFQSMSYSIDVYRRRLEPVRRFLDLAFFIAFFPQLVAGPIVRAMTFLPQVFVKRVWSSVDVRGALTLFFIGFVKKACVSETVAPIVEAYFNNPGRYNVYSTWIAVVFYAVQIYCDFSGYSDMAIATARLLGYELTLNFNFPYFSEHITEFWRRWHISLSHLAARLPLHLPRRKPRHEGFHLPQSHADDAAGRALARRFVELRHLGRAARACAHRAPRMAAGHVRRRGALQAGHELDLRPAHLLLGLHHLGLLSLRADRRSHLAQSDDERLPGGARHP